MSSPSVSSLLDDLRASVRAARRVPVEMALGVFAAVIGSLAISDSAAYGTFAAEAVLSAVPTFVVVFLVSALREFGQVGWGMRWGLTVVALGGGLGYGTFVLDVDLLSEVWRWGLLSGALGLGAMASPWILPPNVGAGRKTVAWLANVRIGTRVVVAGLYTTALTIGTILGVLAFNSLFELGLSEKIYFHIAVWIYAVGGTGLIATGLPELADGWGEGPPDISDWQETIVYWGASLLALPLLGLYLAILYAYGIKILLTGEVPSNFLSPLALGAALIGLITLFLIEPLRRIEKRKWLVTLFDVFPVAYLPILPMPIWAIWVRVQQHGWTEFRYLRILAVLGVTLCFGWIAWRVLRRRTYSALPLPAVFAVLLLIASVGPWGALSVSERSQIAHLQDELRASASEDSSSEHRESQYDAQRRTSYLYGHFGPQSLRPLLDSGQALPTSVAEAQEALGVPSAPRLERPVHLTYNGPISVPSAGTIHRVGIRPESDTAYTLSVNGLSLILTSEGERRDTLSLEERLPDLQAEGDRSQGAVPESLMTFRIEASEQAGQLVLRRLFVERSPESDAEWAIRDAEGILFIPETTEE